MQKNNRPLLIYIIFTLAVFLAFGIRTISSGININADLFSMIPEAAESHALKIADEKLTAGTQNSIFILSKSKNFEAARKNAITAYKALSTASAFPQYFEELTLYNTPSSYTEITDFLKSYRWIFLDTKTINQLNTPSGRIDFAENSLSQLFGGFPLSSLDTLEEDPFLLDEHNLRHFLQLLSDTGTNMSPKNDVLATFYDENWYVLLQGKLTPEGAALASKKNGIQLIYDTLLPLEARAPDCRFVFSGTSFHSHKSSTNASREISLIGTISMLAVLIMLIFVFRSPLPIIASFTSVIVSVAVAFCTTTALFGQIHALTLVFGTSLIGSCIDYSLHFFVNWKSNSALKNGTQIRAFLKKSLSLSLLSTELCYLLLVFAPFPLLKQMAIFSLSGIFSSFLTVMCIFPLFNKKDDEFRHSTLPCKPQPESLCGGNLAATDSSQKPAFSTVFAANHKFKWRTIVFAALSVILLATLFTHKENLKLKNNLSALYKMQGRLKDDTIESAKVLNYTSASWFIVKGSSEEELLQNEEAFTSQFEQATGSSKYICVSRIIPSLQKQENSIAACRLLMQTAEEQFAAIGFDDYEAAAQIAVGKLEKAEKISGGALAHLPSQLKNLTEILWLGEIGGNYYSVFMPSAYVQPELCQKLAAENKNVSFQNKTAQIGEGLDRLSKMILLMFGAAFLAICFVLNFFFSFKQTVKIAIVPLFSVICIGVTFSVTSTPLDFFGVTGMILVFGLGIDYIIYMLEHNGGKLERKAILLSFLTTAISFGTLALSSFVPVHIIGLAIFSGLTAAFIATMLLS